MPFHITKEEVDALFDTHGMVQAAKHPAQSKLDVERTMEEAHAESSDIINKIEDSVEEILDDPVVGVTTKGVRLTLSDFDNIDYFGVNVGNQPHGAIHNQKMHHLIPVKVDDIHTYSEARNVPPLCGAKQGHTYFVSKITSSSGIDPTGAFADYTAEQMRERAIKRLMTAKHDDKGQDTLPLICSRCLARLPVRVPEAYAPVVDDETQTGPDIYERAEEDFDNALVEDSVEESFYCLTCSCNLGLKNKCEWDDCEVVTDREAFPQDYEDSVEEAPVDLFLRTPTPVAEKWLVQAWDTVEGGWCDYGGPQNSRNEAALHMVSLLTMPHNPNDQWTAIEAGMRIVRVPASAPTTEEEE